MAKRVLFLLSSLSFGGAEKHAIDLANSMGSIKSSVAYFKNSTALLTQINRDRVAGVFYLDAKGKFDPFAAIRLVKLVKEHSFSAIICVNLYCMAYAALMKPFLKDVELITIHHTTVLKNRGDAIKFQIYKRFISCSSLFIYVCHKQREYVEEVYRLRHANPLVISNGIDLAHFKDTYGAREKLAFRNALGFSARDFVIGISAVLRPEKRHLDLLQAFKRCRDKGHEVKLLIVGDGPERGNIEQTVSSLGLGEHVRITGFVNDVKKYLSIIDIFALPSCAVETLSIAVLEAMGMEKPIVSSEIGGASELVNHGRNGYLFRPGDIGAMAGYFEQLLDRDRIRRMGAVSREKAIVQFDRQKMLEKYDQTLVQLFFERTLRTGHDEVQ